MFDLGDLLLPLLFGFLNITFFYVPNEWRLRRIGYRYKRYPTAQQPHRFGPSVWTTECGVRRPWRTARFSRLTVDDVWLELKTPLHRAIWISRDDTTAVVWGPLIVFDAIRFATRSGDFDGVAISTRSTPEILAALEHLRWPVPQDSSKVRWPASPRELDPPTFGGRPAGASGPEAHDDGGA